MPEAAHAEPARKPAASPVGMALRFLIFPTAMGACLFLSAGRVDLWNFWAFLAVFTGGSLVSLVTVARKDPSLLAERIKPGPGGKQPYFRKLIIPIFISHWVVAGLDAGRYGWSGAVPAGVKVAGLAGMAAVMLLWAWAYSVNRFFSSDVRIQRDRGHHVITEGPYRYVRHPGYAGVLLLLVFSPMALGSWWSALPLLPALAAFLHRTRLEDRLLLAELEGYADYARRVPWRLIPGIW